MNNILIPTDFTTASLRLTEQALHNTKGKQVNIILFHAFELDMYPPSGEIWKLVFSSLRKKSSKGMVRTSDKVVIEL